MRLFDDPFDASRPLSRCSCGRHDSRAAHDAASAAASGDARITRVVESAMVRAMCPEDGRRRAFLRLVGAGTAPADRVCLAIDSTRLMMEDGTTPPRSAMKGFTVMGQAFDPAKPQACLDASAIRRASFSHVVASAAEQ